MTWMVAHARLLEEDRLVLVREARSQDVEALYEVERAASLAAFAHIYPPHLYPFPDEAIRAKWSSVLAGGDGRVLLAECGNRPEGFISYTGDQLHAIAVVPDRWGSGLADRLYEEALQAVRDAGSATWRLWVMEANGRARHFYEQRGWRPDGPWSQVPFPPYPALVGYVLKVNASGS